MGAQKIKKRDGSLVYFNVEKIAHAIQKAFQDVRGNSDTEKIIKKFQTDLKKEF